MKFNDFLIDTNKLYIDPSKNFIYGLRLKRLPFWKEKDFLTFYTSDLKAQRFIMGNRTTYREINKAYIFALYSQEIDSYIHAVIKEYFKTTLQEMKKKWSFSEIEELLDGEYADIILSVELTENREVIIHSQPLLPPPPQS